MGDRKRTESSEKTRETLAASDSAQFRIARRSQSSYRLHMKATITPGFLETVPQEIRIRLHLHDGMILDFDESAPYLKATPAGEFVSHDDEGDTWVKDSIGMAAGKFTTDDLMRETRGED